jgi:predicted transcriptional regulator
MASASSDARGAVIQREWLLETLRAEPMDKPTLVSRLGVSRSTVDRGIRDLERHDLVSRTPEGFAVTPIGEAVYRAYERFERRLTDIEEMQAVLAHVDAEDDLDPAVLADAEVYLEDAPAPDNVAFQISKISGRADAVRSVTRTISRARSAKRLHNAVVNQGAKFEAVYTVDLASFLTAWGTEDRQEMAESGNYRAFVSDRDAPFTVFLYGQTDADRTDVCVFVYDEDDDPVGVIVNDTDEAVEWAESYFHRFRDDAIEITEQF